MDYRETTQYGATSLAAAASSGVVSPYERQIRFLQRTAAFRQTPRELLEQMAGALQPRTYAAGDPICREGDPAAEFCIIETGTVSIRALIGGQEYELARLGPGESFGEVALLGNRVRTASVYAATPVRLSVLSVEWFTAMLAQSPALAATMAEIARARDRSSSTAGDRLDLSALLQQKSEIRIGRDNDNDVVLAKPFVSRHHATVRVDHDAYRLYDTSSHGTFVNGYQVRGSVVLNDGDEIVIGDDRFVFNRAGTVRVVEPKGIRIDAIHLTRDVKGPKRLLHDISLSILAGEFVAIVGGSGAGKTTLMDALSGIYPATDGQVLYNGRDYYRSIEQHRQSLGYVPQDDILHTELKLRRTMRYAARLRLPRDTPKDEVDRAVDKTFEELGLTERAELRVSALSGGQRKRASIGIELLTQPRIFFLDEPTSGLDPATDGQIMRTLRQLADGGRTVILTTHATKNVMLCDRIIILAKDGHLAYFGPPADALAYFGVTDFDEIYVQLSEAATPEEWDQRFRSSPEFQQIMVEQQAPAADVGGDPNRKPGKAPSRGLRHHLHQARVLSRRNIDLHVPTVGDAMPLVMQPVSFALLCLALFESGLFEPGFANPTAPMQLVFLLSFNAFLIGLLTSMQDIVKELPIFFRERNVGVGVLPYLVSKIAFLAPVVIVGVALLVGVLRLFNRLPSGGFDVYVPLFISLDLVGFAGMAAALMTSALVRKSQQATDLLALWIMPQTLFAGALLAVPAMNNLGQWISHVAVARWGFEATGHAVDLNGVFVASNNDIGKSLIRQYGTSFTDAPVQQWIIMGGFIIIPLLVCWIVLRSRQPQR